MLVLNRCSRDIKGLQFRLKPMLALDVLVSRVYGLPRNGSHTYLGADSGVAKANFPRRLFQASTSALASPLGRGLFCDGYTESTSGMSSTNGWLRGIPPCIKLLFLGPLLTFPPARDCKRNLQWMTDMNIPLISLIARSFSFTLYAYTNSLWAHES